MAQAPWTNHEKETLAKLWAAGYTASRIKQDLPSRSRNGIIGQAHRMGLEPRVKAFKLTEQEMVGFKFMWNKETPVEDMQWAFGIKEKQQIYHMARQHGLTSREVMRSRRVRAENLEAYRAHQMMKPQPVYKKPPGWFDHHAACGDPDCGFLAVPGGERCYSHA